MLTIYFVAIRAASIVFFFSKYISYTRLHAVALSYTWLTANAVVCIVRTQALYFTGERYAALVILALHVITLSCHVSQAPSPAALALTSSSASTASVCEASQKLHSPCTRGGAGLVA